MKEASKNHGRASGGIGELSLTCREAARLQSEGLDRPLTLRQRIGLRIHLFLCKWCRRYGKHLRFLRLAAHEHPDKLAEPSRQTLSDAARERMRQRLRSEGE